MVISAAVCIFHYFYSKYIDMHIFKHICIYESSQKWNDLRPRICEILSTHFVLIDSSAALWTFEIMNHWTVSTVQVGSWCLGDVPMWNFVVIWSLQLLELFSHYEYICYMDVVIPICYYIGAYVLKHMTPCLAVIDIPSPKKDVHSPARSQQFACSASNHDWSSSLIGVIYLDPVFYLWEFSALFWATL